MRFEIDRNCSTRRTLDVQEEKLTSFENGVIGEMGERGR
jgi:hypothetical protein